MDRRITWLSWSLHDVQFFCCFSLKNTEKTWAYLRYLIENTQLIWESGVWLVPEDNFPEDEDIAATILKATVGGNVIYANWSYRIFFPHYLLQDAN